MTRMTRSLAFLSSVPAVLLMAVAVGCGPSEADLKMQDLTAENQQLKSDSAELYRQLNEAAVRDSEARQSIDDLNRELATFRSEREKQQDSGGWVTTPRFDMISISDAVLFASGKAGVTATGRARLAQVAADIRSRYADRDIYVIGHTDAQPIRKSKWKDNWELGSHRALTVVRTLSDLGVPRDNLIAASRGQYRPVVTGAAEAKQARNRRVEVFAVRQGTTIADTDAPGRYSND